MAVYITGDTHGDFRQIGDFCFTMGTRREDVMIVLGPTAWTRNTGCGWDTAGFRTSSLPMRLRSM